MTTQPVDASAVPPPPGRPIGALIFDIVLWGGLIATAFDSSAIRQLGTCYLHALEGYNLLELHKLIGLQDLARRRAVDLLDSASRGAVIAVHFLARSPMDEPQSEPEASPQDETKQTEAQASPEA